MAHNKDLKLLKKYYHTLSNVLGSCHMPEYHLFMVDVWRKLDRIEGYIKARKEKMLRCPPVRSNIVSTVRNARTVAAIEAVKGKGQFF